MCEHDDNVSLPLSLSIYIYILPMPSLCSVDHVLIDTVQDKVSHLAAIDLAQAQEGYTSDTSIEENGQKQHTNSDCSDAGSGSD